MQRRTFLTSTLAASTLSARADIDRHAETPKSFTVKAGAARNGIHTPFRGINVNDIKISGNDTNGQLAVFEYVGHEKTGPSLHIHHDQDEIFSVIEGEYLFEVDESTFTAKAGDTVFAPRKVPHTWIQVSAHGKLVYMVQPAGKLEDFFLKMSQLTGPPTEAFMLSVHKAHGMTVVGPPLALK